MRAVAVYKHRLDHSGILESIRSVFGESRDFASVPKAAARKRLEKDAQRLAEVVYVSVLEAPSERYGTLVVCLPSNDSLEIEVKHEVWFQVSQTLARTARRLKGVRALKFESCQLYDDAGERVGTAKPVSFFRILFGEERLVTTLSVIAALLIALPVTATLLSHGLPSWLFRATGLMVTSEDFLSVFVVEALGLAVAGLARLIYAVVQFVRATGIEYEFLVE